MIPQALRQEKDMLCKTAYCWGCEQLQWSEHVTNRKTEETALWAMAIGKKPYGWT